MSLFISSALSNSGTAYGLNAENGQPVVGANIILWPWSGGSLNELWSIDPDGHIISQMSPPLVVGLGAPVSGSSGGYNLVLCKLNATDPTQQWQVTSTGTIQNMSNQLVITVSGTDATSGAQVIACAAETGQSNQTWQLVPFSPSIAPQVATAVLSSADMIEDYNQTLLPPCQATNNTFCAVANPTTGLTELVTVSDQNQLLWLYPDQSSPSGWNQNTTTFPTAMENLFQLWCFYNTSPVGGSPVLNVLCTDFATGVWLMQYVDSQWSAAAMTAEAASLLTNMPGANALPLVIEIDVDGTPTVLIYGVTVSMQTGLNTLFLLGLVPGSSEWSVWYAQTVPAVDGFSSSDDVFCQAVWQQDEGQLTVVLTYFPGGPPTQIWFSGSVDVSAGSVTLPQTAELSVTSDVGLFANCASNVITVPSTAWFSLLCASIGPNGGNFGDVGLWVADETGASTVTYLSSGSDQPQQIMAFDAGQLPDGSVVAFVLDNDNLLWMLQQQIDTNGDIGFAPWVQLGDYGTAIAVPPIMSVPQVVLYDADGSIILLSQNANGSWFSQTMATPSLPSQTYPACNGTPQTFCSVLNPTTNNTELLSITAQGQLLWLTPNASAPSGSSQSTTAFLGITQGPPTWLCAFYATSGAGGPPILTVFYGGGDFTFDGGQPAFGMQYCGLQWSSVTYHNISNPLGQVQRQPLQFVQTGSAESPTVLVYGVSSSGSVEIPTAFFLGPQAGTTNWCVYYQGILTPSSGDQPYLLAGMFPGSDTDLIFSDCNHSGAQDWLTGTVDFANGTMTGASSLGAWNPSMQPPRQVISVPCSSNTGSYSLLVVDASNQLTNWYINGTTPGSECLTGVSGAPQEVCQLAVAYATDGSIYAFALNPISNDVWFLQQTSQTGTGAFEWIAIGNFGSPVLAIAAAPVQSNDPQLFLPNSNGEILSITFWGPPAASGNQSWTAATVAGPYQAPPPLVSATTYTIELTAVNGNGNPVPGTILSVEPDTPQTLVVNNIAYMAAPGTPVLGEADANGHVTVAALSTALASPVFTVAILGTQGNGTQNAPQPAGSFRADAFVHQRLAAKQSADYQTAGFLPENVDQDTAATFTQNMQTVAQCAVAMALPIAPAAPVAPRGFVFDFSTRGKLACRDLTRHELAAFLARTPASDSAGGSIWGDIAHFFKKAWHDVEKITVTVGDDIRILITNAEDDLETYILETIDDIRDALEVILQALNHLWDEIVDFIKKAIDWLKALFEWQDIINTKNVLKYFFQQNVGNLQQLLGSTALQGWIDTQFKTLESDVATAFGKLESVFGETTFNDAAGSSSNPMFKGSSPLQAVPLNTQYSLQSMRTNYVTSKATGPLSNVGGGNTSGNVAAFASTTSTIETAFLNAFPAGAIQNASAGLLQMMQNIDSISTFLDTGICAVLTAAEDLALLAIGGIQGVIDALLEVAVEALQALMAFLDQPIDVPVISALYLKITGSTLTLLDLLCLMLALPCTILYKIFFGGSTASPPFTSAQVQQFCSSSIPWPWFSKSGDAATVPQRASETAEMSQDTQVVIEVLQVCAGFIALLFMVADGLGDFLNITNQDLSKQDQVDAGDMQALSLADMILTFLLTAILMPWSAPPPKSTADILNLINSGAPFIPWLVNVETFVVQQAANENGAETKFAEKWGPVCMTVLGALQVGLGVATAVEMANDSNYNALDKAAAVLGGCGNACKVAALFPAEFFPAAAACFVVGDAAGDFAAPVLSLISYIESVDSAAAA